MQVFKLQRLQSVAFRCDNEVVHKILTAIFNGWQMSYFILNGCYRFSLINTSIFSPAFYGSNSTSFKYFKTSLLSQFNTSEISHLAIQYFKN